MKHIKYKMEVMAMSIMENVSETQSNNEKIDEIYRKLHEIDEMFPDEDLSETTAAANQEKKEQTDVKFDFYGDDKISGAIEESTREKKVFWFPISPEDLLKMSNEELSEMIVCTSILRRNMNDGSLSEEELKTSMTYQRALADAVLASNLGKNRNPEKSILTPDSLEQRFGAVDRNHDEETVGVFSWSEVERDNISCRKENTMIFDDGMRKKYGKALKKETIFFMPVKAEDLVKYSPGEISEMIVSMSDLRKRLVDGDLTVDGLVREIEFRNAAADSALGWVLDINSELLRIKEMAAMEPEDDAAVRAEMLEKLKGNLEKLPIEELQEMLLRLEEYDGQNGESE